MATNISIKGKTAGGDGVTTSINYVNPNANNEQLTSLATAFNNLTTNTISDITKITKESLTGTGKISRNASIRPATLTAAQIGGDVFSSQTTVLVTLQGATIDDLSVKAVNFEDDENEGMLAFSWFSTQTEGVFQLNVARQGDIAGDIIVSVPETDIYQSGSVTLTVTES